MTSTIRLATLSDADAIASVHIRTWQAAYRGLMPDAFLDALDVVARADRWRRNLSEPGGDTFVIHHEDGLVYGFGSLLAARDDDATPHTGDLAALYIAPERWRSGAGGSLMAAITTRAHERGFTELYLWVLEGNTRARAFYKAFGFQPDGRIKTEAYGEATLSGLRCRRPVTSLNNESRA